MKKSVLIMGLAASLLAIVPLMRPWQAPGPKLTPIEELGKRLFMAVQLSSPARQACVVCHAPSVGFTGPDEAFNKGGAVYEGAMKGRFGNRKPPASAYAGDSPVLHQDRESGDFIGGMFWDGRATGEVLGDPLAEQALGPPLNPLEQNMPDKKSAILAAKAMGLTELFESVWGPGTLDAEKDPDAAYARIGRSIAAYERSAEVNRYSSKFDVFWRAAKAKNLDVARIKPENQKSFAGLGLTPVEFQGLVLFSSKGRCAECHSLESRDGKPPVFTDYGYDNVGVPRNPENPFYRQDVKYNPDGAKWVDKGLGGFLEGNDKYKTFASLNYGRFKVPTLRNVDLRPSPDFVKAYAHNGYFKSLKDLVHFYNTRDKKGAAWPAPEVAANLNVKLLGNLGLTAGEEEALVAFLATLSDQPVAARSGAL